jgi:hypothetical protein
MTGDCYLLLEEGKGNALSPLCRLSLGIVQYSQFPISADPNAVPSIASHRSERLEFSKTLTPSATYLFIFSLQQKESCAANPI